MEELVIVFVILLVFSLVNAERSSLQNSSANNWCFPVAFSGCDGSEGTLLQKENLGYPLELSLYCFHCWDGYFTETSDWCCICYANPSY